VALRRWNPRNADESLNVAVRSHTVAGVMKKNTMTMIMMMKKRTTITISLLPVIWNLKKRTTKTTTMMKMKTKMTMTIMSNLIPGMTTMKMKITAANVAMKTTTMTAVTASHGIKVRVSSATVADNTKAVATTAVKAVPAPTRTGVPQAVAGALLQWTAIRSGVSPAKAAGLLIKAEAEMGMTKMAVVAQAADHLPQAGDPPIIVGRPRPLPPVVAVRRTTQQVVAGRVHLPGAAMQVLRGTATPDNNAMPADSSPAGAAVQVTAASPIRAAGPIPVAVIATAAAIAIAATANHS